jgi:hypothetical protein
MAKEVLGRRSVASFWDGIQDQYQEQLQAVRDQNLPLVSKDYVVVWDAPCRRIVL